MNVCLSTGMIKPNKSQETIRTQTIALELQKIDSELMHLLHKPRTKQWRVNRQFPSVYVPYYKHPLR